MQWITDKTVGIFADTAMLTMALACICFLFSFTLDCAEEYLDRLLKECRERRRLARTVKPTRAWRGQRGAQMLRRTKYAMRLRRGEKAACIVEFALILPLMLLLIVGGAMLHIALVDYGRLHFSVQESSRAAALVLLTVDSGGAITRHESEARLAAVSVFNANRPGGAADATILIDSSRIEVSSRKSLDFLGFIPARDIEARSTSVALPVFCP